VVITKRGGFGYPLSPLQVTLPAAVKTRPLQTEGVCQDQVTANCHGGVSRVTTGCAGEGIRAEGQSFGSWLTFDVDYGSKRRTTNLCRSLHNAIHDSTPPLRAELLRGLDAVIRDVNIEDDDDKDKQRQDESERIT
jgi:hypothetical protein